LAKVSPHVLDPARFGLHIAVHLLSRYAHITAAFVAVEQLRWARIGAGTGTDSCAGGAAAVGGHKHAFWRDGTEKRFVEVEVARKSDGDGAKALVAGGLKDLLGALMTRIFPHPSAYSIFGSDVFGGRGVRTQSIADRFSVVLKSTGSAFENFVRDEYTTLAEVDDRIFSTSVDLRYTYGEVGVKLPPRGTHEDQGPSILDFGEETFNRSRTGVIHPWEDNKIGARAREATLDVFVHDESASVQATLYKMAQRVLAENAGVESVRYVLPNKHYIPVDMKYIGVDNTTPQNAEVFTPVDAPSGLISATISRQ